MSSKKSRPAPYLWTNLQAARAGRPERGSAEFALYTDAHLTSEIRDGLGPIQILNTVPIHADEIGHTQGSGQGHVAREARPILLRVADHLVGSSASTATWLDNSDVDEEMSGLLAVALGRRFKAGGLTRRFRPGGDPMGDPYEYGHHRPYLPQPSGLFYPMLPDIRQPAGLDSARELLALFALLDAVDAAALVASAGAFRDAIWVSDGQPEESWIRLVSAVEAAAGRAKLSAQEEQDALEQVQPDLARALRAADEGLFVDAAHRLANLTRSTKRFVQFLLDHLPDPPAHESSRSPSAWTSPLLKRRFAKIYGIRSDALHDNVPVPWLMTRPPGSLQPDVWKLMFDAAHTVDGVEYGPGDVPMLLDTFAYVVRGALISWWRDRAGHPNRSA